jgi:beta-galactosidase GanA
MTRLAIAATGAPAPRQPVGAGCVRAGAVSYDERSMIFDGQRQLMLSGAIHFARVMPQDWDRVLGMAADMGLNTVQTYVMWNFHEHERGQISWSGRRNLTRFVELAGQHGLAGLLLVG